MHPDQLTLSAAGSEALHELAQRTGKPEAELLAAVRELAQRTGKSEADLLHEVVFTLTYQTEASSRLTALRQARGMWEHRTDLPDFDQLRAEGWQPVVIASHE